MSGLFLVAECSRPSVGWPLDIFNRTNHPDPDWSVSNIACLCADPISELLRKMVSLFMLFRSIRFIANEEWRHYLKKSRTACV